MEEGEHCFDDWIVTKEPTGTEAGQKERSCTICGYTESEEIPKETGGTGSGDTDHDSDGTGTGKPGQPSGGGKDTDVEAVDSGDSHTMGLWLGLLVSGIVVATGLTVVVKRRRSDDR